MAKPYTQLHLHLIWATWDRSPVIHPDIQERLYSAIRAEFRRMGCMPLAIGGTENHVHCLVSLPVTHSIADIVKQVKGATSHLMSQAVAGLNGFKWQGSYGAFAVMPHALERLREYIENQEMHHRCDSLWLAWERTAAETPPSDQDA